MTAVPKELDRRFRQAAADSGLVDVSFDVADTQIGRLLLAVTDRGLCRISYDPEPERETEELARTFGVRVLRAPKEVDLVRRELDEYLAAARRARRRHDHEPQPDPDRAPVPPRRRLDGKPGRLRRRARPQARAPRSGIRTLTVDADLE